MELEIQKYLRKNGLNALELQETYGVYTKFHQLFPQLVTFKYDMIEAKFSEQLTCECRGLILNASDNWNVVARAYDKFFNYGEGNAAPIDWESARVLEKLDGSLCMLYWNKYKNHWDVATQGTPDACGDVNGYPTTFANMFWETFNMLEYKLPELKHQTYIFELMRNENRIVVRHEKPRLVLHGIRCIFEEDGYQQARLGTLIRYGVVYGWEIVKSYNLTSIDAVIESCKTMDPMNQEGYVVCDENFNRVKVKSPQYLALHSMRDGFGPRRVIEMIRLNESDEWLSYFPEFRDIHDKYKVQYDALVTALEAAWQKYSHIENRKDFALAIKDVPLNGALFQRYGHQNSTKKTTFKEYMANLSIKSFMEYFNEV